MLYFDPPLRRFYYALSRVLCQEFVQSTPAKFSLRLHPCILADQALGHSLTPLLVMSY